MRLSAAVPIVTPDGKRKLVRVKEGKPIINIAKERLAVCEKGYHIVGNFCACNLWRECDIRREEYLDYKVKQSMKGLK